MNRTSKITRLPETLREELNQRLRNGEPAHLILPWLNKLPEVIALVEEHYGGNLISPQNLSDWNLGGYREWLTRQEMRESSQDFATEAPHLTAAAGGSLLNPLTTAVLASVEESHVGTASGLNSAVARTGGLIATALLGLVLGRAGASLVQVYTGMVYEGPGIARNIVAGLQSKLAAAGVTSLKQAVGSAH